MRANILKFLLLCLSPVLGWSQVAIGTWTDHLSYQHATRVAESGPLIFTATSNAIFSLNTADQSIERISKFNSLSETGIACIDASPTTLVIGYESGNIDLLSDDRVTNINAVKTNQSLPDKRLFDIVVFDDKAYVCAAFGILVIDLQRKDVSETYFIGANAAKIPVYSLSKHTNKWFAATAEGVKSAPLTGVNLQDYNNWQPVTSENIPAASYAQLVTVNDTLFYRRSDTVSRYNETSFQKYYISNKHINAIRALGRDLITLEAAQGSAQILKLNSSSGPSTIIPSSALLTNPVDLISDNDEVFIADSVNGLVRYASGEFTMINPSSPVGNKVTALFSSLNATWSASDDPISLSVFKNRSWQNFTASSFPLLQGNEGFQSIVEDPVSKDIFAGSLNDGLFKIDNSGSFVNYKEGSFISPSLASATSYPVTGLAFDASNTLWISNSNANRPLVARSENGEPHTFAAPFQSLGQIVIDDLMQKWVVSPGAGLLCFTSGPQLSNPSDDQWKIFQAGVGAGNLPTNDVLSIAKDRNNFIWVGTSSGIGIIQCPELAFTNQSCEAILPVVRQGNFNGYLFRGERVQSIAVDGVDRKWIGTRNGAWLISSDGATTIQRVTTDNSPIPSNDIRHITIDPTTGEVYFGTSAGLCSYRGTATEPAEGKTTAVVFPNPVPPGFNGTIGIRGLAANSTVKITELNGRLVYQGKSNGGQFTWNGLNYLGRRAASGIYLVLVSGEGRKESIATKIIILNK